MNKNMVRVNDDVYAMLKQYAASSDRSITNAANYLIRQQLSEVAVVPKHTPERDQSEKLVQDGKVIQVPRIYSDKVPSKCPNCNKYACECK